MADLYYYESGYIDESYFVYTADAQAQFSGYIEDSYIEDGYWEYYGASSSWSATATITSGQTLEAEAALALVSAVIADIGVTKVFASTQSVSVTETADIARIRSTDSALTTSATETVIAYRIIEADCDVGALFSPSVTATAFKNHTAIFETTVTLSTAPVVNRSATITLDNLINQNAQAAKTAVFTIDYQVTATQALTANKTTDTQANYTVSADINSLGGKLKTATAAFSIDALVKTSKTFGTGRPRPYTSSGSPLISTSIKKFGAASARVSGTNYVSVPASPDWLLVKTVDLWFYVATGDQGQHNLLVWGSLSGSFARIFLEGFSNGIGIITIDSDQGQLWTRSYLSGSRPALDSWHHLRILDDGSAFTVWLNGSKQTATSTTYNSLGFTRNAELRLAMLSNLGNQFYIDELLITKQVLTPASTTSFSVPTDRWKPADQSQIYLLSHFDTDFSDDVGVWESAQSNISATAAIIAQANPNTKSVSSSLTATATQTTAGTAVKIADAQLSLSATQNTDTDRIRVVDSDQTVTATMSAVIGAIKQFDIDVDSLFDSSLDADITARPAVYLETQSTITATAVKTTDIVSSQSAVVTQTASILYTAGASSAQNLDTAQTTDGIRVRYADSTQAVSASISAIGNKIPPFSASLEITTAITTDATKFKRTTAAVSAEFTTPDIKAHVKHNGVASMEQAFFVETVTGTRVRFFDSTQTVDATTSAQAVKTATAVITDTAEFTQSTVAHKTTDVTVANMVLFGSSIDADLTARPFVYLETQSSLSTIIGVIKEFVPNRIGIRSPDTLVDNGGVNIDVISIWAQETTAQTRSTIWSSHGFDEPFVGRVQLLRLEIVNDDDLRLSYDYSGIVYNWLWESVVPGDGLWHQYVIAYRGSQQIPGTDNYFKIFELFIDGVSQGTKSTIYNSNFAFNTDALGNIFLGQTVNGAFQPITDSFIGNLAQIWGGYDITVYADPALNYTVDQIVSRLNNTGPVDLGSDGTLGGLLPTPRFYSQLKTTSASLTTGQAPTEYLQLPDMAARFTVTGRFIGVFLYTASLSVDTTQAVTITRIQSTPAQLSVNADLQAQLTGEVAGQAQLSATATITVAISKTTGYTAALDAGFTETAVIGRRESGLAALTDDFDLFADYLVIAPTRAEAALSSEFTMAITATSFTEATVFNLGEFAVTADITVIPPIRTTAAMTVTAAITVTIGTIEQFAALTQSSGTLTCAPVKTTDLEQDLAATATADIAGFKYTGAVVSITALHSTLIAGDVINIDPFLTLIIEPETRILTVTQESRQLSIESETRSLIIEGWE